MGGTSPELRLVLSFCFRCWKRRDKRRKKQKRVEMEVAACVKSLDLVKNNSGGSCGRRALAFF